MRRRLVERVKQRDCDLTAIDLTIDSDFYTDVQRFAQERDLLQRTPLFIVTAILLHQVQGVAGGALGFDQLPALTDDEPCFRVNGLVCLLRQGLLTRKSKQQDQDQVRRKGSLSWHRSRPGAWHC